MTLHAENALRCPSISEVFYLLLTIPTLEASCAECLVPSQDSEVLDLVTTIAAAVCAVIAYQRAVAKEQEIGIAIKEGSTGVASKAVDVPSVSS